MEPKLQPALFSTEPSPAERLPALSRPARIELVRHELRLLEDDMTSYSSITDQIKHLRWLYGAARRSEGPETLAALSADPVRAAGLLTEPGQRATLSQLSTVWKAFAAFIRSEVDPATATARIAAIDRLLLPRRTMGWFQVERVPGGQHLHTEGHRVLLFAVDLLKLRESAAGSDGQGLRDRALVGLCCGSGLRWAEIVSLRWEQLTWDGVPSGKLFPLAVSCNRREKELSLPVHVNAVADLAELYRRVERSVQGRPQGPVFCESHYPHLQLGVREGQKILARALRRAGLPSAGLQDLKAAFADHLSATHGITDLELTEILGYGEHKHVRQLLRHHKAVRLNAQVDAAEGGG